ncbi:FMN-binding negative transcriptional regulator [Naumannella sp. ID2617S]|uniref:Transcriptional regulator n=1 Tax=Enemella dayhoffiae TaxID=2016507 RepID=A0A255H5B4_9ACTN|nr:FMN-binding negative transcriptional regulator [Enemella dayhoffiae]NNG20744.1 FMN-binding negative transcriptional regulator [Naumannella sp. ID2617S]OYO22827.1 transcriptional regulator [Enemella dayhoffiae]
MWIPDRFALPADEALEILHEMGSGDLVTPGPDGLQATFVPWVFDEGTGELGVLRGHLARQNPHWQLLRDTAAESLLIVHGPDSYISPNWYASKATNPKVVPTWNYTTVHVHGRVVVHEEPDWILRQVNAQTDKFEEPFAEPWRVRDAPADFVAGLARAIVGVELRVSRIEAKAKQSQNRPAEDVVSLVQGLRSVGDHDGASAVADANRHRLR